MLMKRNNTYHLRRRVPVRYRAVEPRDSIYVSLHTDSKSVAEQKASLVWQHQLEAWEAKMAGDVEDAERRFAAAQSLAKIRGFRYMPAPKIAELPRDELLARVEAVAQRYGAADPREAAAVLGGAPEPAITVSRALEMYWGFSRDLILGKSHDQMRRWRNPRVKAIRNFISVIGDKAISDISRDDMLDFREWWMQRLEADRLTANSANKDLVHLGEVLKLVNERRRLKLDLPLSGLTFKEGTAGRRPPFSTGWIKDRLLADGALDGLNPEARAILIGMVNTGARPSELAALTPQEIRLDANVPHLALAPVDRQLKSKNAVRILPLLGVSLEAFRQFPDGFPRYRVNSAGLSATVNKYLRENGLLETSGHSLYGLRHSFEDRMLAAKIDERIRRDLMGHSLGRERYGDGASLQMLQELLAPVAL